MWSRFAVIQRRIRTISALQACWQLSKINFYARRISGLSRTDPTTVSTLFFVKNLHSSIMSLPSDVQAKIDAVENVEIDPDGRFKYVLMKLYHPDHEDQFKYIARGFSWGEYHADIYDNLRERVEGIGLETECVGGGRILHESGKKALKVFGYSQGFGRADHQITVELLKKKYPGYNVSWSNDGY